MRVDDFVALHPELYHMADHRNFANILRRGLMSTEALLDLFEVSGEARRALLSEHRPESVTITHSDLGVAIVRDQKPMSLKGLERSVEDATPAEFLEFLNRRSFFWPSLHRLKKMNGARAYRSEPHVVFVVCSRTLIPAHGDRILLSPMNSGATTPMPHPRSIGMFVPINDYDFDAVPRAKLDRIGELTVESGVPDLMDHVVRIEVWKRGDCVAELAKPYDPGYFD